VPKPIRRYTMNVVGTVGKAGCVVAGGVLEGGALGLQAVGSVLVAVGTGFVRTGNKVADGSAFFYEKAGMQHRPVRLLTSVDEINRELEEAEKKFTEFYQALTKNAIPYTEAVVDTEAEEELPAAASTEAPKVEQKPVIAPAVHTLIAEAI